MKLSKFLTFTVLMAFMAVSLVGCDDDGGNNSNNVNNNNNNQNAVCGNGILEGDEVCDGTDFGDVTCESRGFTGGTLSCSDDCSTIDDSQCEQSCENACTNGTLVCNGDILRSCETDADTGCTVWVDTDCSANGETCSTVDGTPQCTSGGCTDNCTENEVQCDGDMLQTCEVQANGCTDWSDTTDCSVNGEICDVVNGTAQCTAGCTDNCTENEVQCDGDVLQTCEVQANGCTDWSDTTDCSSNGEICDVVSGTAQCTAGCTDNCTANELQCDGDVLQTCEVQANGCTDWSDTTDCSVNGEICSTSDGTPVCAAPPVHGSCGDPITVNLPYTADGTDLHDVSVSNESFEGANCDSANGIEAVYAVNLQQDATLMVEASGDDYVIRVLDTCDPANAECLASADDEFSSGTEHIEFVVPASGIYYVVVEAYGSTEVERAYNIAIYTVDATETACGDGLDNDDDGNTDCDDSDCFGVGPCTTESNCTDGLDNDGDGHIDCDDTDCASAYNCATKKGIYEQFSSDNPTDLEGLRIVYGVGGSGEYYYSVTADATFFVTPGSTGDATFTNLDSHTYHVSLPFTFNFYGKDYNELWVTTNGVIVFDATPSNNMDYESVTTFFEHPAIAVMWDDLTYINSGDVLYADHGTSGSLQYWAFTYTSKEYNSSNYLTAQVVLFSDGTIRVDYITNMVSDGIAGISSPGALGTVNPVRLNNYPETGDVLFTEIMYNPAAVDDQYGEYVEIYNKAAYYVNIYGCELTDGNNTKKIDDIWTLDDNSLGIFVRDTDSTTNGGIDDVKSLGDVTLNNGGDTISLICNGKIIDSVTYPDNASAGYSLMLDFYTSTSELNDNFDLNWCVTPASVTYGDGDHGSPGIGNGYCYTSIYYESFESNPSWTVTGDWEWGTPDATSYSAGPPACAAGTGCYGTNMSGAYSSSTDYDTNYVQMPVLDLSSYSSSNVIRLMFKMWLETENNYDYARVEVSTDGVNFSVLDTFITPAYNTSSSDAWMGTVANPWKSVVVSLSDYAGNSTVYVRFALDSDSGINKAGFYIDDVSVGVK